MKAITISFCALLAFNLVAQKPPIKFGNVPKEDLEMTTYLQDSSAVAVVLADFGESSIIFNQLNGFEIQFERIRRVKILTKEGYDWANFSIPLYRQDNLDEKLTTLKAVTVNLENGKSSETKLGKDGIFEEIVSENWSQTKLTMPNVMVGSVIDITYKVTSPYLFNFQDWEFQTTIPVRWSEYQARIPEYYEYQRFLQGYVQLKINETSSQSRTITITTKNREAGNFYANTTSFNNQNFEYRENFFRWVAVDVPSLVEEPHMVSYRNYISKLNFELMRIRMPNQPVRVVMGTWENINKELLDANEFGGVVKRSNFLNRIVEDLTSDKKTDLEKIDAICSYIRKNVLWNGEYRKYTDGNFKRVLDEKKGNSAEINLMLVSMLQKAGLNADPVVISTRNHGFVREQFPQSSQFNYVICATELEDKLILLDVTDNSLPAYQLPQRCLNGVGFLISESRSRWVDLNPQVSTKTVFDATLEFDKEGLLKGKVKLVKEGYDGQQMRVDYNSKGKEDYIKTFNQKNGWNIQASEIENLTNLSEPVKETYEMSLEEGDRLASDIIYLNPLIGRGIGENPFKLETRVFPVDFASPFEQTNLVKLKIPDGYEVEELPQPLAISLPDKGGRFLYTIGKMNGVISLTSLFSINKTRYSQTEYQSLREFYNQVVAKQGELIVLKKSRD